MADEKPPRPSPLKPPPQVPGAARTALGHGPPKPLSPAPQKPPALLRRTVDLHVKTVSLGAHAKAVGVDTNARTVAATDPARTVLSTSGAAVSIAGGVRTTVLPRVEISGERPTLVHEARSRFEPLRALGEGGAGEVTAAMDHDIGRTVAVKKIRAEARCDEMVARFVEEIRTVGSLEHPNVVPIHDVGVDEAGDYYFVMKYVDGETLESIIARLKAGDAEAHREYGFERRVQIFRGLLEAVAFAHSRGIVHRDLKPANVMIGRFGEVLLMDWGIAKSIRGEGVGLDDTTVERVVQKSGDTSRFARTQIGAIIGTPIYMSPEQARGEPVDERSDVYSLTVLLHELLCLTHYLEGRDALDDVLAGVVSQPLQITKIKASPHQPIVPMDLRWYLKKGMEKDRTKRYQSAREMIDRLDARADGRVPIQCHVTFTKRLSTEFTRLVERHPIACTALFVIAVAGIATIPLWTRLL
ncbi:MAG: serine/threonine protein kinase [Proteobacteria bacterium]|jgi:serine/threonine-protein kinase|nr:serine/threonine protein kinase [Pseudomonadota bacterium]